jgi:hypothetical protein
MRVKSLSAMPGPWSTISISAPSPSRDSDVYRRARAVPERVAEHVHHHLLHAQPIPRALDRRRRTQRQLAARQLGRRAQRVEHLRDRLSQLERL